MSLNNLLGVVDVTNFGPRFNLVGLLPSTVLILFFLMLFLLWSDEPSTIPNFENVVNKLSSLDLSEAALLIIVVIILSLLVQPLQRSIFRFMEGYWSNKGLFGFFTEVGIDIQRGKRRALEEGTAPEIGKNPSDRQLNKMRRQRSEARRHLNANFPKDSRLLPTAFGNVVRAGEDLAGTRYGLPTVAVWPRIYPLLPDKTKSIVDDQRNQLDVAIRFSFIFMIATIGSFILYLSILYNASQTDLQFYVMLNSPVFSNLPLGGIEIWAGLGIKYWGWLIIPASTLLLAFLFYRGANSLAASYGIALRMAFDLHRFDLLKALHLPLPKNSEDEHYENKKLARFFTEEFLKGKIMPIFTYDHANGIGDDSEINDLVDTY